MAGLKNLFSSPEKQTSPVSLKPVPTDLAPFPGARGTQLPGVPQLQARASSVPQPTVRRQGNSPGLLEVLQMLQQG